MVKVGNPCGKVGDAGAARLRGVALTAEAADVTCSSQPPSWTEEGLRGLHKIHLWYRLGDCARREREIGSHAYLLDEATRPTYYHVLGSSDPLHPRGRTTRASERASSSYSSCLLICAGSHTKRSRSRLPATELGLGEFASHGDPLCHSRDPRRLAGMPDRESHLSTLLCPGCRYRRDKGGFSPWFYWLVK